MKPLKLILLLGAVLTLCSFGSLLASAGGRALLLIAGAIACIGVYDLYTRGRKPRIFVPARSRRRGPIVVRRPPRRW